MPILTHVSAETLLASCVNLFILCIIKHIYAKDSKEILYTAILFGITGGLGTVTKMTFAPLLLYPLIVLPKVRNKLIFLLTFCFSFFIFTLPIVTKYKKFYIWIKNLFVNSGTHGHGRENYFDLSKYLHDLYSIILNNSFLSILLMLLIITSFWKIINRKSIKPDCLNIKIDITILLVFLFQYLIVAKQNASHYLTPVIGLIGIIFWLLSNTLKNTVKIRNVHIFIFLSVFILAHSTKMLNYRKILFNKNSEIQQFSSTIYNKYKNCIICGYFPSSSKAFALDFGDTNAGNNAYKEILKKQFPNTILYHYWTGNFHYFGQPISFSKLKEINPCILLYGRPDSFNQKGLVLKKIETNNFEALYRVLDSHKEKAIYHLIKSKQLLSQKKIQDAYKHALLAEKYDVIEVKQLYYTFKRDFK